MVDVTNVVNAVVGLATLVITTFVVPVLKSKFTAQKLQKAATLSSIFCKAADQLFSEEQKEQKKQYVLAQLANHGYSVNSDTVLAIMESSVHEIHNSVTSTSVSQGSTGMTDPAANPTDSVEQPSPATDPTSPPVLDPVTVPQTTAINVTPEVAAALRSLGVVTA